MYYTNIDIYHCPIISICWWEANEKCHILDLLILTARSKFLDADTQAMIMNYLIHVKFRCIYIFLYYNLDFREYIYVIM